VKRLGLVTLVAATLAAAASHAHDGEAHPDAPDTPDPAAVLAPGYGPLGFEFPQPGSYALPALFEAADGAVLDSDGRATRLHEVFGDRVVLLSFVYASCNDVNGCPLATSVLQRVKSRFREEPDLAERVRLVSLSFDPVRDTPEVMRGYGKNFVGDSVEWRFLTTRSQRELEPILAAYDQSVWSDRDVAGNEVGTLSHILRVFLIDAQRRVRNIYTVSFLHPDTLVGDVKTLLLDGRPSPASAARRVRADALRPGDDRTDYADADFRTRSLDLGSRRGREADLLALSRRPALGRPPLPVPADNPLTVEKIALGRRLFFDRRLSLNGTLSCAMCHIPEQGFTSNEMATAIGIEGRSVRRNAPSLLDSGYRSRLFHDARETRLEHQIWGPLLAANEMGNPSVGAVLETLRSTSDYAERFSTAFPERGLAIETLGMALASYQRTLVSGDSAFDRWHYADAGDAISNRAQQGFRLFTGKAGCASCHTVGPFSDSRLYNTGIGYAASMKSKPPRTQRIQVAPGSVLEVDRQIIAQVSEPVPNDLGRYEITLDPDDRWKYRTPTLRNVALTAPYMHDGSLATLGDVVAHYDRGGVPNPGLDPRIRTLDLDAEERDALVAFLETLTGSAVETLVSDAFAAPIGDPGRGAQELPSESN
jgi:cytochrome c peroxidase